MLRLVTASCLLALIAVQVVAESCYTENGEDYMGKVNTTSSGRTCQRWDANSPHINTNYRNADKYPDNSVAEAGNYCRRLGYSAGLWCYTTDSSKRWELCSNIKECPETDEFECEEDGLFPDPDDCSNFYNCGHGTAWKQECQAGLVFNPNKGACDWPENYKCGEAKTTTTPTPEAEFVDMGCYKNKVPQKVDLLERTDERLDKFNYKKRESPIEKCYAVAKDAGYENFGIGNKGQCWGSNANDYAHYGPAKNCPKSGLGKYAVINVYSIANPISNDDDDDDDDEDEDDK